MLINSSRSDVPPSASYIKLPPRPSREAPPAAPVARLDRGLRAAPASHAIHPMVEISPSDIARRRALTWRGIAAEVVQFATHERTKLHFHAPLHLLVAYEEGERRDGDTFIEGLPRSTLRHFARKLTFVPAGSEFSEWHEPGTPTRLILVYFDHQTLDVDEEFAGRSLPPRLFFEDATLWSTVLKLKASLEGRTQIDPLYAEALGVVLMHELAQLGRAARRTNPPIRGGLAPWQERTVTAYIDDHLGEPITLTTLADLVRLSPHHFCRAFKRSFGVPPLRYHKARRIERAKALLVRPGSSVTDTGLTVGFMETSAFSTAFRKETGLTPTEYRRSFG